MIAVCLKWSGGLFSPGLSAADEAAIEMALRHADVSGGSVIAVTVGSVVADRALRVAIGCGVTTAIRVDAPDDMDSASVAAALSPVVAHSLAVWCGDYSLDRGTGSVPAFLAARLQRQQALGLIDVQLGEPLQVTRRLDGGRREVLRITGPAVLSVEGSVARLRRASLRAALASQTAEVLPFGIAPVPSGITATASVRSYRPRARVLSAPSGTTALERVRALTDVSAAAQPGEMIEASPAGAARRILEVLGDWGYLEVTR